MAVHSEQTLYTHVVHITHDYLGPASERFIDRQVRNHLQKEPENITEKDLLHLIDWIRVAVSMLTEDRRVVEQYIRQLQQLAYESQRT